MILEVFVDESCKNGKKFLAVGGVGIRANRRPQVIEWVNEIRKNYAKETSEVKWTKLRPSLLPFYKDFIDAFFRASRLDYVHYHALIVDTSLSKRSLLKLSDESQFSRLIYQLLLHKFGRRYHNDYDIDVYLDERSTKEPVGEMVKMLNRGISNIFDTFLEPFNKVVLMPSENSNLIQMCDLLTAALATRRNGHDLVAGAATQRTALGSHIEAQVAELRKSGAMKHTVWEFAWNPMRPLPVKAVSAVNLS